MVPMSATIRVAPSRRYGPALLEKARLGPELLDLLDGPGRKLNLISGKKLPEVRGKLEGKPVPYQGVVVRNGKVARVDDIPNPDSPDGKWDPTRYMPRFLFDPKEDAYPVDPAFDGDADLGNNGPRTAHGRPGNYLDGVIGGKQPLSTGFAVTRKGEYTVLTYSFYYAHNKAGAYHPNDYSTAQVYLRPGKNGKLQPTHLYTSFHHGGVLSRYDELRKDSQGRPMVRIWLGTHALLPVGKNERPPRSGVEVLGDGSVRVRGKATPLRMTFDAFQSNVQGARTLALSDPKTQARVSAMRWGEVALNPFLPKVFENADIGDDLRGHANRLASRLASRGRAAANRVAVSGERVVKNVASRGDQVANTLADRGGAALKKLGRDLFR